MNKLMVLKYLGYDNQIIDNHMDTLIEDCINEVDKIKGHTVYKTFDFSVDENISIHDTVIQFQSKSVTHILSQSKKLVLFTATLGPIMDQLILKSGYESKVKQMILDACASAKIESIIDEMMDSIEGFKSPRFSPGYGDLSLKIQGDIVNVLEARRIGITVTDSSLMIPKKSVSGLFGLSDEKMTVNYLFCDDCLKRTSCDHKICKRE